MFRGLNNMAKIIMTRNYCGLVAQQKLDVFDGDDAVDCSKANHWIWKLGQHKKNRDGSPLFLLIPKNCAEEIE